MLWVTPPTEFNPLEAALIPNSKTALQETGFEHLNETETQKDKLDDANKLYVALTRSASNLFVYTGETKSKIKGVCHHFMEWISKHSALNPNSQTLEVGNLNPPHQKKEPSENRFILNDYISTYDEKKLMMGYQAPKFWDGDNVLSPKEVGNTLHFLLSKINHFDDLTTKLDELLISGELGADIYPQVKTNLERILKDAEEKGWMGKELKSRNEMELLYVSNAGKEILRPDRVVFHEDYTWIIDYKTGSQKPEHQQQVRKYMEAIASMNYPNPKGTLIYIETGMEVSVAL